MEWEFDDERGWGRLGVELLMPPTQQRLDVDGLVAMDSRLHLVGAEAGVKGVRRPLSADNKEETKLTQKAKTKANKQGKRQTVNGK